MNWRVLVWKLFNGKTYGSWYWVVEVQRRSLKSFQYEVFLVHILKTIHVIMHNCTRLFQDECKVNFSVSRTVNSKFTGIQLLTQCKCGRCVSPWIWRRLYRVITVQFETFVFFFELPCFHSVPIFTPWRSPFKILDE